MIEVRGITREFGKGDVITRALRGVDLDVQDGDFMAIMGKSGAGKSTFLHQMSLLDHPTDGSIVINGTDVLAMTSNERTEFRLHNLGYIFQDYALVPELTATENVMVPLLMEGMESAEARKIAHRALKKVQLGHRLDNLPTKLSGGEQQRVSVARAVSQNPSILFADEPTANLDSVSSMAVLDLLKELNDAGQTIIMVTHEEDYTMYCNRIIYMKDGMIQREVKKRPKKKK